MDSDWQLLVLVAVVYAFAGWIKGVIGLGLPTIATGLMGLFVSPLQAAALVVLPALVTNVWQMLYGPGLIALLLRLWPLLASIVAGTIATAGFVAGSDVKLNVAVLGLVLMAYALHALVGTSVSVPRSREPLVGAIAGLATGVISGTTGVFVVPSVPFLQSIGLDKDELVQAIGITAFTSALALALGLGVHGGLGKASLLPAVTAVAAGMAGMGLGQLVRAGLSHALFRRCVLLGLAGLGATMVARALV